MKHLKKHKLIYDSECPMCNAYSQAFIKTGMLDQSGREGYQHMSTDTCLLIDRDRARNEIALVNTETGKVTYGIESLFTIIGQNFTCFLPLFHFPPFCWVMTKLYSFISYNRKVIMPGSPDDTCTPDFHTGYRWGYLIFTWLVSSFILTKYSTHLTGIIPPTHFFREFFICGGQLLFQAIAVHFLSKGKAMNYLGNMMTVSFAGSILLVVVMLVGKFMKVINPVIYSIFFMLVVALMFLEHARRVKRIDVHWAASASWVAYRLLVLGIIL